MMQQKSRVTSSQTVEQVFDFVLFYFAGGLVALSCIPCKFCFELIKFPTDRKVRNVISLSFIQKRRRIFTSVSQKHACNVILCLHPDCKYNVSLLQISRLVGCPPFWHRKQMYMLRAIMEGRYSFSSPEWNDISDPPKDLVSSSVQITVYTNIWYQIRERITMQL